MIIVCMTCNINEADVGMGFVYMRIYIIVINANMSTLHTKIKRIPLLLFIQKFNLNFLKALIINKNIKLFILMLLRIITMQLCMHNILCLEWNNGVKDCSIILTGPLDVSQCFLKHIIMSVVIIIFLIVSWKCDMLASIEIMTCMQRPCEFGFFMLRKKLAILKDVSQSINGKCAETCFSSSLLYHAL